MAAAAVLVSSLLLRHEPRGVTMFGVVRAVTPFDACSPALPWGSGECYAGRLRAASGRETGR